MDLRLSSQLFVFMQRKKTAGYIVLLLNKEKGEMNMKKYVWLTILTALFLSLIFSGVVHAEIIQPYGPGQQIGYPAVVLCETLTLREKPSSSSKAIQTLSYGDRPIVVGADLPSLSILPGIGLKRKHRYMPGMILLPLRLLCLTKEPGFPF